ncbi:hypothetical protein MRB53_039729 [Persea americana]|nr:hypothetical protein MRB53_039729 [Persea americana]
MEKELGLPTSLFGGPPVLNDIVKMGESQIGFMQFFAGPLFGGLEKILPQMHFAIHELDTNKQIWQDKIRQEQARLASQSEHTPVSGQARDVHRSDPTPEVGEITSASKISVSSPTSRKGSAGTAMQVLGMSGTQEGRRSSLGPTVLPNAFGTGSKRSSGSRSRASPRTPPSGGRRTSITTGGRDNLDGAASAASPPLSPELDNTEAIAENLSPRRGSLAVRELPPPGLLDGTFDDPPISPPFEPLSPEVADGGGVQENFQPSKSHSMSPPSSPDAAKREAPDGQMDKAAKVKPPAASISTRSLEHEQGREMQASSQGPPSPASAASARDRSEVRKRRSKFNLKFWKRSRTGRARISETSPATEEYKSGMEYRA